MFDHVAGDGSYIPTSKPGAVRLISLAAHVMILAAVALVPMLWLTTELPTPPAMMAFIASAPAPPPPPPPPPPVAKRSTPAVRPAQTTGAFVAPAEVPAAITPESGIQEGVPGGVEGGVEGGIEGGVAGGVLGGLPVDPPAPPPPPAPVEAPKAVRVGGDIQAPALVARIEPKYPLIALKAQIQGLVILEAEVDAEGRVTGVRILRSGGILDEAALEAVKQWRYSPLSLNGRAVPFVVAVTVAFRLEVPRGAPEARRAMS
jgi:protein TonB